MKNKSEIWHRKSEIWNDELKYIFNKNKVDETTVKNAFKKLFTGNKQSEIFDVIWNNQNLRNSLFTSTDDAVSAFSEFETMINTMDNKLFGFIKVE